MAPVASGTLSAIRITVMLLAFAMIVLNTWFLYYVEQIKMHGCTCAMVWQRTFMQASLITFIVLGTIGLFVNWSRHFVWLALLVNLLAITYVFVTRSFIFEIEKTHCKCAESAAYEVIGWLNVFQITMLVLALVAVMLALVVGAAKTGGKSTSKMVRRR